MFYYTWKKKKRNRCFWSVILSYILRLHACFLPRYLIMKQQIIHRASSWLLHCLCKCVICRIQQFPCDKLLKKRYVIPRYNNLCAVKVKFVIIFHLDINFSLTLLVLLLVKGRTPPFLTHQEWSASHFSLQYWWQELRVWSKKMWCADTSTTAPHYFRENAARNERI